MTPEIVTELGRQALETTLMVSAPILGLSVLVGLLVSAFQAMTQLNEATLTFVPKILAVLLVLAAVCPWMGRQLAAFAAQAWGSGF